MKIRIFTFLFLTAFLLIDFNAFSQCDPMTADECADPENNGEICPDTLQTAFLYQFYSQVATIKPPAVYYLPPDSTEISLHHVKLMQVGNLPSGLTWLSNTADSVFMAGEYYCVLMEGTPDSAGVFPLKITVDVYVLVFGTPLKVASVTDSTSLAINVIDNTGIGEKYDWDAASLHNVPNPFSSETTISYFSDKSSSGSFEIYSIQGKRVHKETIQSHKGDNQLIYNGRALAPGMYFYRMQLDGFQASGIMIRSDH